MCRTGDGGTGGAAGQVMNHSEPDQHTVMVHQSPQWRDKGVHGWEDNVKPSRSISDEQVMLQKCKGYGGQG